MLGVLLHAVGGFAAGSFYAPLKKVTPWAWESLWLVMGLAAWLIAPWAVGFATTPDLIGVLAASPPSAWLGCLLFGLLWGIGNLGFGLSVRYLGMALGYSIALGSCMIFGTLMPPIANGQLSQIVSTHSGMMILAGVMMCLAGIALCGWAGARKEKELQFEAPLPKARTSGSPAAGDQGDTSSPSDATTQAAGEFSIGRGFLVATMAGILSACFAFGLAAGKPIANQAIANGTPEIFSNNAVLVVILVGGLTSNAAWCLYLNTRNKTFGDYIGTRAGSTATRQVSNYALSLLAGAIWYCQFFFYGMGTTKLGEEYDFSSWTIHMSFIIVFSNIWGIVFREWKGTSNTTQAFVWAGLLTLIGSTALIGYGNSLASTIVH